MASLEQKVFLVSFKKNIMAATGVFFHVLHFISTYISLIIGPRGLGGKTNLWEIMGWESSDVFRLDLGPLLQGQMSRAKLKIARKVLTIGLTYRKSCSVSLLMSSNFILGLFFKIKKDNLT